MATAAAALECCESVLNSPGGMLRECADAVKYDGNVCTCFKIYIQTFFCFSQPSLSVSVLFRMPKICIILKNIYMSTFLFCVFFGGIVFFFLPFSPAWGFLHFALGSEGNADKRVSDWLIDPAGLTFPPRHITTAPEKQGKGSIFMSTCLWTLKCIWFFFFYWSSQIILIKWITVSNTVESPGALGTNRSLSHCV